MFTPIRGRLPSLGRFQNRYFSSKVVKQRLENKIAVITGAANGIGRETTKLFIENGAKVIGIDIDKPGLDKLKKEYSNAFDGIESDISKEDNIKAYTSEIIDQYKSIDILVNNAGIVGHFGPVFDITNEEWRYLMDVNVLNVFWNCKYFIPSMLNKNTDIKGSIINISSICGLRAANGQGSYVVSKHAVYGLTKQIGIEYIQQGVRCNSVHPGWCETEIIDQITSVCEAKIGVKPDALLSKTADRVPTKRFAQTSEIVPVILFLGSDESSWCNAQPFVVDAGHTQYI